ncbi:hypothetical protein Acy02nite_80480 [Actinoplanes cyaneus]|uniref:Uncharacterized protein n=1 Tax=Actinoplanes cyaneus TaxID=52696 RepID=A0A919IRU4_9ACTN|nr:hypothetical protein [Actinoplanes cyaneus]MCW2143317.1 hypothetical protein [Actinoplanes cyaneus]GID70167.1 hypothetical protein Acy02nite_80480 [Actinoplanes cyaneus]
MKLFRRRPPLPAEHRPPLDAEERVLTWARSEEGVLVATNRGIWLPGAGERLGWHEIHKVAWSGRELRITPAEVAGERDGYTVLVDGPVMTFLLLEPGELPNQVRARVTRSVAFTTHHEIEHGALRVVGRRVSGQDGLSWAVRYDAGSWTDWPAVIEATGELVAAAQNSVAPPP